MDLTNDGTVLNCIRSTPDLDLSFNSDFNSFLDLDLSLPASVAGINTSDLGAVVDNSHNINSRPNNVHRSLQLNNFVADYAVTNCPNCAQIKAMYERQYQDHRYNTQLLKKRIISTDKLLRRYKFKQNDILFKNILIINVS
ncbi:hypothetical protein Bpfe_021067 [Biomphalaria pfeifferi]|uniref:Uncharacterized protein n=1 Tax=Biomphalaria pfeifferi TaxID=112525 RepID=A0AAD8B7U0_BIOPF|nr:hypothetical protein Bpfe_021067 [Biomphalaria pfeifferi]